MYKTSVRKVGGSVMVAIPPFVLDQSGIVPGQKCGIEFKEGRIQIMADPLPEYRLEELMANSEFPEIDDLGDEELKYINATVVGG
ncbi:antitoxin [Brucella pseudogrignonensis]|uniref:AbrB/MazE/SpoVT family DNA-binding domain-containing protein n=1 Tax=Brucella pseudogrignonensis TaxID=419475 RepID=UPI0028B9A683|nr:antitoxin [Brucella pseudogrignonensis]MDT6942386.1 antitoxin [Brucella pseudogrignonensis]